MSTIIRNLIPPYKIFFTWDILYECNYRCSYCNKCYGPVFSYPSLQKILYLWNEIYKKYGNCHIHIAGGEPFLFPNFLDLVDNLSNFHTVEFSTNLSFEVEPIIEKLNPYKIRIQASYHPEFANFDDFIDKVKLLKHEGFNVWVTYVAYPPYIDLLPFYKNEFEKITRFYIFPFGGKFDNKEYPYSYTENEKKILGIYSENNKVNKEMVEWRTNLDKSYTKGKFCRMGQMYAKIYPDGEVRACCFDKAVRLGNFYNETFELLDEPVLCENEICPCWKSMIVNKESEWLKYYPSFIETERRRNAE